MEGDQMSEVKRAIDDLSLIMQGLSSKQNTGEINVPGTVRVLERIRSSIIAHDTRPSLELSQEEIAIIRKALFSWQDGLYDSACRALLAKLGGAV
jgi:hypothetical protein